MGRKIKKYLPEIKKYFEAPEPQEKSIFINKMCQENISGNKISSWYMLWVQFSFISKWLWIISALLFICGFITSRYISEEIIWFISAAVPFIVTFSLSESMRSVIYGMQEFEMASRFTLKSIIMSRVIILGVGNMFLLFIAVFLSGNNMWRNVIYILVPYLSSAIGGFVILRKFPAREGVYLSSIFSVIISVIDIKTAYEYSFIYEARYTGIWIIAVLLMFAAASYESCKMADTISSNVYAVK